MVFWQQFKKLGHDLKFNVHFNELLVNNSILVFRWFVQLTLFDLELIVNYARESVFAV